jgi:cell division transport system permease protein
LRYSTGGYLLGETGKSIWRSKMSSFLSCATTALSLFLLGIAFLINLNLNFMFTVVQNQMEIQAYLKRDVTEVQAAATVEAVRKMPGVSEARYVSKADALEELKVMFRDKTAVLEGLGNENPLPASVRARTASPADVPKVVAEMKKLLTVDDVIYQEEASRRLASLGRASQLVSLGGMLVVGLVAVMVIGNSIRLTIDARRHEIGIMKLVGATDEFIIGPFLLEGMALGLLGGLLGEGMVVGLYTWMVGGLETVLPFIPIAKLTSRTAVDMLGIMLVTGVAVGVIGSVVSLRRHLNV